MLNSKGKFPRMKTNFPNTIRLRISQGVTIRTKATSATTSGRRVTLCRAILGEGAAVQRWVLVCRRHAGHARVKGSTLNSDGLVSAANPQSRPKTAHFRRLRLSPNSIQKNTSNESWPFLARPGDFRG